MRANEIREADREDGWSLASERAANVAAPAAAGPARLTMQEIDDGWVLTDEAPPPSRAPGPAAAEAAPASRLDLNRATLEQLCALPGIGRLRARRILSLRENLGQFATVSDLAQVKGIGAQTLEQLTALVTVAPPTDAPAPQPERAQTSPAQSWTGSEAYARAAEPEPGDSLDQSVA